MWSKDLFSFMITTMWSMFASVEGEKSYVVPGFPGVGQSVGTSGTNTFFGPV